MPLELKNKKALNIYLAQYAARIEKALIFNLEVLVAQLQNHAKQNAEYNDQTSNLKGSIGGIVLKNGSIISYKGFDSGGAEGRTEGTDFINSLTQNYGAGYTILLVAGMEYAAYVEDIHELNVLKKSELKMQRELPKLLLTLKQKLNAL